MNSGGPGIGVPASHGSLKVCYVLGETIFFGVVGTFLADEPLEFLRFKSQTLQ